MPAAPMPTARSTPFKASCCEEIAATGGANRPTTAPAAGISAMPPAKPLSKPLSKALSKAEAAAAVAANAMAGFTTAAMIELETGTLGGLAETAGNAMSVEAAATLAPAPASAAPEPAASAAPAAPATRTGATLFEAALATAAVSAEPICDPATAPVVAAPRAAPVFTGSAAPTGGNGVASLVATSALVPASPVPNIPRIGPQVSSNAITMSAPPTIKLFRVVGVIFFSYWIDQIVL